MFAQKSLKNGNVFNTGSAFFVARKIRYLFPGITVLMLLGSVILFFYQFGSRQNAPF